MRIRSTVFRLVVLAGLVVPPHCGSQDTAAALPSADPSSLLTTMSVSKQADRIYVELAFTKPVKANVTTLEHPSRLVLDFAGCRLSRPDKQAINSLPVVAVRSGQFSVAPLIARVVIEFSSAYDHEEIYSDNKLVIGLKAKDIAPPATPATTRNNAAPASSTSSSLSAPESLQAPVPSARTKPAETSAGGNIQLHSYTLLAKARSLTLADLEPLEARAHDGDPAAETMLALAYHAGTLLKQDDAQALRILRRAASRGFVAAEEAMGTFCQLGFGMSPDKAQAVAWYTKAAQHGSKDAATNLALMYATGEGVQKDAAQAAVWFRTASEAGDATAQLNLAALYHRGEGLPHDDRQAALWLAKAAEQNFVPAMLEWAAWNLQPEHGSNVDTAVVWFKKAADLGDASAQVALGDIFADQKFGRLDYVQAVNWYRKAADQGHRGGQFGLGMRYMRGEGVARDLEEARRWLTPAADQGHAYAQFVLAKMFEMGEGTTADSSLAAKYYELSANSGVAEAQYRLGVLLASNRGDPTHIVSAYKWLTLAQASVRESAVTAAEVRKLLTATQLAQAEREIDEWRIAHPRHSGP
jgi:TPR repeat protein